MKKVLFAVCLVAATSPAFAQTINPNNSGGNHGQNDCECVGIGIPFPNHEDQSPNADNPNNGNPTPQAITVEDKTKHSQGLWYTYLQLYLLQAQNVVHNNSVK